jgi:Protein of unknown function (DUF742)
MGDRAPHGAGAPPPDFVRPFVLTGGRTRASNASLRMETMVQTANAAPQRFTFEHARIVDCCWEPRSVAEVAAEVGMPLGVAIVLVGDLVDAGCLQVTQSNPVELELETITRMIERVRAL